MKFLDFHPGQVIEAGPCVLTADEIVAFAKAYDPQWFHVDAEAASRGRFGGLIASGWQTCAVAMRMVAVSALEGSESFASPGIENIRWPSPVRPDDELLLTATVLEVRRSSSRPELGILRWRWELHNQEQSQVLDLVATSLFSLPAEADV